MKSKIENFFLDSNDIENFKVKYIDYFKQALSQVDEIKLSVVLEEIISCQKRGGKIISFGNGGSAANAAHFCTGISYVTRNWESPISAMSLNQDTILITSLANDLGYEQIFYRQLQVVAKKEDLVVGFSVSGKSKNVVNALKFAKEKKMRTVGFLGSDGGDVLSLVDIPVLIENTNTLLGFTEDIHMTICHIVAYYLEFSYKNDRSE